MSVKVKKTEKQKSAEIINLSARRSNIQPMDWENTYQVCQLLQYEVQNAMASGVKISKMAEKANVCAQTVSNIGYGETKHPRAETCIKLLRKVFGYKVTISS